MDRVQLPQGWSHFENAVYFLPLSSQKFLVLILSTSEGERLIRHWSHPVVLNTGTLDWESSALTKYHTATPNNGLKCLRLTKTSAAIF